MKLALSAAPAVPAMPDFRAPAFLQGHILQTMAFYEGRCIDSSGGFFQAFRDDGSVYDPTIRQLDGSARFVLIHALALRHFPHRPQADGWRHAVQHGLDFIARAHAEPGSGEPVWSLRWDGALPAGQRRTVLDATLRCDGLALLLQAQAHALRAGVLASAQPLQATFALMEQRFWQPTRGCYADPAGAEGHTNVQACEALMAAFDACGDERHLDRAAQVADAITGRPQRQLSGGIATVQLTQWARLLLAIERARPDHAHDDPLVHRARELFAAGISPGWDRAHGGLAASLAPDTAPGHQGRYVVSDADKHAAAHAESIAAAAVLAERTLEGGYWDWYDRLWLFAWEHFIDHRHGGWYRLLGPDNRKPNDLKSPPGKTDARTMGACYEVLASLAR